MNRETVETTKDYGKLSMEELRERCKKNYYIGFQRRMHHGMLYLTRPLLKTNIRPNQITVFWLMIQFTAAVLMIFGTYKLNVIGILLYTLAGTLDYIDGQIARIKGISTFKGIWMEEMGNYFGSALFFLGLSIGTARAYGEPLYFVLGVISAIAILYSMLCVVNPMTFPEDKREILLKIRRKASSRSKNKIVAYFMLIFRRSNLFNLLFFGILFNIPRVILGIYAPLYFFVLFRNLFTQAYALYKLDKAMFNEENKKVLNKKIKESKIEEIKKELLAEVRKT
jgi:phosphatidylglycerophosphate synthase